MLPSVVTLLCPVAWAAWEGKAVSLLPLPAPAITPSQLIIDFGGSWGNLTVLPASPDTESPSRLFYSILWGGRWGWNGNGGWWLDYLRCAPREVIRKLLSVIEGRVIQAKI